MDDIFDQFEKPAAQEPLPAPEPAANVEVPVQNVTTPYKAPTDDPIDLFEMNPAQRQSHEAQNTLGQLAASDAKKIAGGTSDDFIPKRWGFNLEPNSESINAALSDRIKTTRDIFKAEHPGEQFDEKAYREQAVNQVKAKRLDYYKGYWQEKNAGGLSGEYLAERIPGVKTFVGAFNTSDLYMASKRMQDDKATDEDYKVIGHYLAKTEAESQRGLGRTTLDFLTSAPATLAEWAIGGGPAEIGREAAMKLAGKVVGEIAEKAAIKAAIGAVGAGVARTLVRPDVIGQGVAQRLTPQVNTDSPGQRRLVDEGEAWAIPKAVASELITNTVWEAIGGPPGAKTLKEGFTGGLGKAITEAAQGTGKALGASEAIKSAEFLGGLGGKGSTLARVLHGDEDATKEAAAEILGFALMEGGMRVALNKKVAEQKERGIDPEGPTGKAELKAVVEDAVEGMKAKTEAKQPWQMTREEYNQSRGDKLGVPVTTNDKIPGTIGGPDSDAIMSTTTVKDAGTTTKNRKIETRSDAAPGSVTHELMHVIEDNLGINFRDSPDATTAATKKGATNLVNLLGDSPRATEHYSRPGEVVRRLMEHWLSGDEGKADVRHFAPELADIFDKANIDQYRDMLQSHKSVVEKALAEGKPVPPEVLAAYPDRAKTPVTAPEAPPAAPEAKPAEPAPEAVTAPETPPEPVVEPPKPPLRERLGARPKKDAAPRPQKLEPVSGKVNEADPLTAQVDDAKREALKAGLSNEPIGKSEASGTDEGTLSGTQSGTHEGGELTRDITPEAIERRLGPKLWDEFQKLGAIPDAQRTAKQANRFNKLAEKGYGLTFKEGSLRDLADLHGVSQEQVRLNPEKYGYVPKDKGEVDLSRHEIRTKSQEEGDQADGGFFYGPGVQSGKPAPPMAQPAREGYVDAFKTALAPATRGKTAEIGSGIMRQDLAIMARQKEIARKALNDGMDYYDKLIASFPDKATRDGMFLRFTDAMEAGNTQSLHQPIREFAETARKLIDERSDQIRQRGIVKTFIEDYMSHLWKSPTAAPGSPQTGAMLSGRRPLAGKEGFKKERIIPTYRDGIDLGLEPIDPNPIRVVLASLEQMDKSIMAHDVRYELKQQGLRQFVRLGAKAPDNWVRGTDRAETVFRPGEAKVTEYFDKKQMEGLENFAGSLGIDVNTMMEGRDIVAAGMKAGLPAPTGAANKMMGASFTDKVIRKFGTPEEILAHEVGHQLDSKYNLQAMLADPVIGKELTDLADLRASGRVDPKYQQYIRQDNERIANLVAAYLHAPELLAKEAPNSLRALEAKIASEPSLAPLKDIKPSLQLGEREQAIRLAGPLLAGHYYYPEPVAKLLDNYASPSFRGNKIFDAARNFGNQMNMFQLGFGAFHAGFVAMDTQVSAVALGLQQLSRGQLGKGLLSIAKAPTAPFEAWFQGSKVLKELTKPGSQGAEIAATVKSLMEAGGRGRMDEFYDSNNIAQMRKAIREVQAGTGGKKDALLSALPALAEAISKPTMEQLVPRMKLSVFADMARYELERLGPSADLNARRDALGKAWDSVENRLGQLTYDNVFWNRKLKDLAMLSVRSVGWNVGTGRELGGGIKDIGGLVKGQVSPRLAYAVALPLVAGFYGAMYQYLATGKGPDELKDYFFPKNGRKRADGSADRVSLPSYMRDVQHVLNRADEGPTRIAQNMAEMGAGKLHPALTTVWEMLTNKDFFGSAIWDPKEIDKWGPGVKPAFDTAMHLIKAFEPFTTRNVRDRKGATTGDYLQGLIGITPAPSRVVHTWEQQRQAESEHNVTTTPLYKLRQKQKTK